MISLTQESVPGTRRQKVQLHPGDVRFNDGGDYEKRDVRGEKIRQDTYGIGQMEQELFGERTDLVSPTELVEQEQFYRTLNRLKTANEKREEETDVTFASR